MLYDPKWEAKADPMSLAALIAWLEKQPPDSKYDFMCISGGCLLDLYFGRCTTPSEYVAFPESWRMDIAPGFPRTFGGALERARALAVD